MKRIIYQFTFTVLAIFLLGNTSVLAQSDSQATDEKTVIITIVTKDDQVIVKKKRINPGELPSDFDEFQDLNSDDIKTIDVKIVEKSGAKKECLPSKDCDPKKCEKSKDCIQHGNSMHDNQFFFMRNLGTIVDVETDEDMEEVRTRMKNHRNEWNMQFGDDPKPLLGVYVSDEKTEKGVILSNVMLGRGAANAGLQRGNIITKVDGKEINSADDIGAAIKGNKPGDSVQVDFIQNGERKSASVELSASRKRFRHSAFRYNHFEKRDPCKVFIGVYTGAKKEGVRISDIIDGTPAADMDLKKGDIILAFDNVTVSSQSELVQERDLNEPGDHFKMTILRDGEKKSVRGQFKSCDEETPDSPDVTDIEKEETPAGNLEVFQAYPNPTFGEINVSFRGEAVPTTIRITDVTGKVVFEDEVPNFDGYYNRQVQVNNARPGNLSVSVIQNNRATTKNIILLNRA